MPERRNESSAAQSWRFVVKDFAGTILATRRKGRIAAENLTRLAGERPGLIEISFEGCLGMTGPFADEFLDAVDALGDRTIYSCLDDDLHGDLTLWENKRMEARGVL
jgi:hypothetical protein